MGWGGKKRSAEHGCQRARNHGTSIDSCTMLAPFLPPRLFCLQTSSLIFVIELFISLVATVYCSIISDSTYTKFHDLGRRISEIRIYKWRPIIPSPAQIILLAGAALSPLLLHRVACYCFSCRMPSPGTGIAQGIGYRILRLR